jgi:hypothetical protein
MEDSDTKVLQKRPPLPSNSILPEVKDAEVAHTEDDLLKERWSDDDEIKGTERSEENVPVNEAESSIEPKSEKLLDG